MPTSRPFAFNSGSTLPNTSQVGNVAIGTGSTLNYSGGYGGLEWWMGPDEDLGYIITYQANAQSSPVAGNQQKFNSGGHNLKQRHHSLHWQHIFQILPKHLQQELKLQHG